MTTMFPTHRRRVSRRGFMILEVAVTSLILVIAMVTTLKLLVWVASERRATERRQTAIQEAGNLMERLTAWPFDDLNTDAARSLRLSEAAQKTLPIAKLEVVVTGEKTSPRAKRVAIGIRWLTRAGTFDAPVRLTAWTYPEREQP